MLSRLVLVTLLFPSFNAQLPVQSVFAQVPEDTLPSFIESPTPAPTISPAPVNMDEQSPPESLPYKHDDTVLKLGKLRSAVLVSPGSADNRLKLDGRAAAAAVKEAILLDPELTQAHYSLGSVQYSLGNLTSAIQSYRRALELQPSFPDARYRLALILKLANRNQESVQFMEEAATAGIPQAQFFMGNAYRNGQGVEKNLTSAIRWWNKAFEFGHQRAAEALSQLRRQASSPDQSERRQKEALEAFRNYRETLWADHPEAVRSDPNESLGIALLKDNQVSKGIAALFDEAYALSEAAHDELARLYERGLDPHLAQFDKRILTCFETTVADGFIPAKKALAHIYGKGLGVTPDLQKAKATLKGLSKQEIKSVLDEIAGR
ncbi:MAG: sel1 repeat family protein [Nitrospirae bacterium]|nr:sel1 repeat family protein [Nitrospirota bacterium]